MPREAGSSGYFPPSWRGLAHRGDPARAFLPLLRRLVCARTHAAHPWNVWNRHAALPARNPGSLRGLEFVLIRNLGGRTRCAVEAALPGVRLDERPRRLTRRRQRCAAAASLRQLLAQKRRRGGILLTLTCGFADCPIRPRTTPNLSATGTPPATNLESHRWSCARALNMGDEVGQREIVKQLHLFDDNLGKRSPAAL